MNDQATIEKKPLPPNQYEYPSYDRFGLGLFAFRFPSNTDSIELSIGGDVSSELVVSEQLAELPRVQQHSDFHCVTTWSVRNLHWEGVRFSDFYQQIVQRLAIPKEGASFVVFRGQDRYACSMQLQDLLRDDVLLADTLNGEKLGVDHGAPIRLVAPSHYGYKNVKHISRIEFWQGRKNYRFPFPYPDLMDHPRGRVAFEERARFIPNWIIRPLYRALMPFARRKHQKGLQQYLSTADKG